MPSITWWNRLEPRPRSDDLANALAAKVRDPAWFLARQWQLGELRGEDAASPAYLKLSATVTPIVASSSPSDEPLERRVTREPFSAEDTTLRVELGQIMERMLAESPVLAPLIPQYRTHFMIPDAAPPPAPPDDPRAARLRSLWKGRVVDGVAAYLQWQATPDTFPPFVDTTEEQDAATTVMEALVDWVHSTYRVIGEGLPPAWVPERLEYQANAYAFDDGNLKTLTTRPDRNGKLPAHAFDELVATPPPGFTPPSEPPLTVTVLPGQVRFPGMPNACFWDFEDGRVNFGGLKPDRRDLARLILADFMLVHGTDWFLIPFEQPVGTICRATVTVVDVFGESTTIPRADTVGTKRWTMYSTAVRGGGTPTLAAYFLLPESVGEAAQDGAPVEHVRFLRDEMANMVWAVERETEGHLGIAVPGDERGRPEEPPPPASDEPLVYRLRTNVPRNWIPFQPRQIDAGTGAIALERSTLIESPGELPSPHGRVLTPPVPPGQAYRIREEEVPREGTRVTRLPRWSRWTDGTTHVWITRARGAGTGEGSSGLKFDLALKPEEETT